MALIRAKTQNMMQKTKKLNRMNSGANFNRSSRLIGESMTKLFKDDHLYETELINNPNFQLQSLRDHSCLNAEKISVESDNDEADQAAFHNGQETHNETTHKQFKYASDESLYD